MNQSEEKLSAALRGLAEASRQGPPPETGAMLKAEFRRYHGQRRHRRRMQISMMAACLAVYAVLLMISIHANRPPEMRANRPGPARPAVAATGTASSERLAPHMVKAASAHAAHAARRNSAKVPDDFMVLPSYDPAPSGDELRVVRMEVPGRVLQLVGAPVNEEVADRRVLAEFVLGADGTPYAVRLVRNSYGN